MPISLIVLSCLRSLSPLIEGSIASIHLLQSERQPVPLLANLRRQLVSSVGCPAAPCWSDR